MRLRGIFHIEADSGKKRIRDMMHVKEKIKQSSAGQNLPGITLSRAQIESYLKKLETAGYSQSTLQGYRRNLEHLYQYLLEGKYIQAGTLAAWQEKLLESGYSVKSVNVGTAAANGLMLHLGRTDLQVERLPEPEDSIQPELTRVEYLRLLSTARILGKERIYLLIKLFGTTGITVSELEHLTVEAVRAGELIQSSGSVRIPGGLREELLYFIKTEGIISGPVFLSKKGTPQERTVITAMIKSLCRDAQVPEEKVNPRCLRRMYMATQAGIQENLAFLAEQAYERLLEKEQRVIGWDL